MIINFTTGMAIAQFPDLALLATLAGDTRPRWAFSGEHDQANTLTVVMGNRLWPCGTQDTLGFRADNLTQARVVRLNPLRERVFEHIDTLAALVDIVAERLIDPADPLAPHRQLPIQVAGYTPPPRQLVP